MWLCRSCVQRYTNGAVPLGMVTINTQNRNRCTRCIRTAYLLDVPDHAVIKRTEKPMDVVVIADGRQLVATPEDIAHLLMRPMKAFAVLSDGVSGERFEVTTSETEDDLGKPNGLGFIIIGRHK